MADPTVSASGPIGHDTHDLGLIAALLDRDLADVDRAAGEALVVSCQACATLHADLVALATATAGLPATPRPREFTLVPDVAAAITRSAEGEPHRTPARLTGEMTDTRTSHAIHDRMLIADLLDRSPDPTERARAEEQLATCSECAQLHVDLMLLSAATRAMDLPARPRDFTLDPQDAERLRIHGWRRLFGAIGSSRDIFSRPLAIGLTTLGLAGLLVATVPTSFLGAGGATTSLPASEDATGNAAGDAGAGSGAFLEAAPQASAAPSEAAASGPAAAAAAPTSTAPPIDAAPVPAASPVESSPEVLAEGGESSPVAGEPDDRGALDTYLRGFESSDSSGPSPLLILASLLLVTGIGLFGLRWTARRLSDG